jgi:ABC-type Fe3+-hydroxamate transport system substrate-binding protein
MRRGIKGEMDKRVKMKNIPKTWKAERPGGSIRLARKFAVFVLFCALPAALCWPQADMARALDSLVTVTDGRGEKVSFPKDPQRIVTLSFSSLEVVRLLGAVDRVVAVGTVKKGIIREKCVPEIENMVSLGSGTNPDVELLASVNPDLVITWGSYHGEYLGKSLRAFWDQGVETGLL